MTDPIRPMVSLVEAIARSAKTSNAKSVEQGASKSASAEGSAKNPPLQVAAKPFSTVLKTRLTAIDPADKKQLRRIFVEVSLVSEFGEALVLDPGFSALVEQVAEIISVDPSATKQLDQTLIAYLD